MNTPVATFSYWDDEDLTPIAEHQAHWQSYFPDHAVLKRANARQLLERRSPQYLEAFDRIALPACRSDVARLLRLEAGGGLYVDAHCGVLDFEGILSQADRIGVFDLVVSTRYAPKFAKIMPHNSIIWCGPRAPVVSLLLDTALENLAAKGRHEELNGFQAYHVWDITGPGVFWRELFQTDQADGRLKEMWTTTVGTIFEEDNPIQRYRFTRYRAPGRHWSERQTTELLFQDPSSVDPQIDV